MQILFEKLLGFLSLVAAAAATISVEYLVFFALLANSALFVSATASEIIRAQKKRR